MAERLCGCGAALEEQGDRLSCPACGAEARSWLVRFRGQLVGAGDAREAFVAADLLREGLGVRQETLERAAAPGFEREIRDARRAAAKGPGADFPGL